MRLGAKVVLTTAAIFFGLITVLFLISQVVLLGSFRKLEEDDAGRNVERVFSALNEEMKALSSTTRDWAAWDDTYLFVKNRGKAYINSNLTGESLSNLKLSLVVFANQDGEIVYAKAINRQTTEEEAFPAELRSLVSPGSALTSHESPESRLEGIIKYKGGILLAGARPILTSKGVGPARGTLIMGRYIDDEEIRGLSETTRLKVSVIGYEQGLDEKLRKNAVPFIGGNDEILLRAVDEKSIEGYGVVKDIYNKPAFLFKVEMPRGIFNRGRASLYWFMLYLFLAAVISASAIWWLMKRNVLSRLSRLGGRVEAIGLRGNLSERVSVDGGDEITALSTEMNRMLASLERLETERKTAQNNLRQANDELENRIKERTTHLAELENEVLERKRIEGILRKSEASLAEAQRISHLGSWEWDIAKNEVLWSDEIYRIFGLAPREFGATYEAFLKSVHPEDLEFVKKSVDEALWKGRPYRINHRILLPTGDERTVHEQAEVFFNEAGRPLRMIGTVQDITVCKRLEEELFKMQKLESIGVLAGGIAHDFNNILTASSANIFLAKNSLKPDDILHKRLLSAEKALDRAKDLTHKLLTFARGGSPVKQTVFINDLLVNAASVALAGSPARCEYSIPEDLWPVEVDVELMSQVIQNLIANAREAMQEGGTIKIRCENVSVNGDSYCVLPLTEGRYLRISIEDNGDGIPAENLLKIFDPYFTTKGLGNGLGLAVCHSVIKNHHGLITVESNVGVGTTFHVYLQASLKAVVKKTEDSGSRLVRGKGRILVMDDEELIRDALRYILTGLGYEAALACDGVEAIKIYKDARESGRPFDAVIMDLTVNKGMGGREAVKSLLGIDPDIKAIVSSGYANDPVMADPGKYGFRGVIAKPYNITDFSAILYKVINGDA